jgi:hypothetical protein
VVKNRLTSKDRGNLRNRIEMDRILNYEEKTVLLRLLDLVPRGGFKTKRKQHLEYLLENGLSLLAIITVPREVDMGKLRDSPFYLDIKDESPKQEIKKHKLVIV